eukprot:4339534-Alexandrium_andersonii.AAC.1
MVACSTRGSAGIRTGGGDGTGLAAKASLRNRSKPRPVRQGLTCAGGSKPAALSTVAMTSCSTT